MQRTFSPAMRASIIIPTRNRRDSLRRCLTALGRQEYPEFEIIVVSDGASDGTAEMVRGEFGDVRFFQQAWLGQVVARNRGIEAATGDLLVFTDDDCLAPPGWLAAHAAHHADPRVGAVGGPLVPVRPSFFDRVTIARYRREHEQLLRIGHITGWERLLTGNLSFRRDVLEQLGPFDEGFRSGSDADQVRRICRAGYVVVSDPALALSHLKRYDLVMFLAERFRKASGSLMTDVKEGTLRARRFVPMIDPVDTARVWRDYRELYGGSAAAGLAFWSLALVVRLTEVAGRVYYYWTLGRGYRTDGRVR